MCRPIASQRYGGYVELTEFLSLVLPEDGWIVVAEPLSFTDGSGRRVNTFKHYTYDTLEAVQDKADELFRAERNAFFAVATYKEPKVWNPTATNPATGEKGKFELRTQTNCLALRSLFLDLDVNAAPTPRQVDVTYASKVEAATELKAFCAELSLPLPLVVDSGGGLHAYWPLDADVTPDVWLNTAIKLKAACAAWGLRVDTSVPADSARVLRLPGTLNTKRDPVAQVSILTPKLTTQHNLAALDAALTALVGDVTASPRRAVASAPAALTNNIDAAFPPAEFTLIRDRCAQIGAQCASGGADVGYNLWRLALGVAKFTSAPEQASHELSHMHAGYSPAETAVKMDDWRTAPTTCDYFKAECPGRCEGCKYAGKITSPAQLGRDVKEASPPTAEVAPPLPRPSVAGFEECPHAETAEETREVVTLPNPPWPYVRTEDGTVVRRDEDEDGVESIITVCPNDLYPVRIMRQSGTDADIREQSLWRVKLDRMGWVDMMIRQDVLSDTKKVHAELLRNGVYLSPQQAKETQLYMSAYLKTLSGAVDRDQLYERMGWHENHTAFVMGNTVVTRDGKARFTESTRAADISTDGAIKPAGNLRDWVETMKFYDGDSYAGHRFFIYAAFAAPLFHMTGHRGAMLTASGESGRGKTTCLEACASIWGSPDNMIVNGSKQGTTINALYHKLGSYHSMPFMWDDTTERGGDEIREFLLNISQGKGKVRMHGDEISKRPAEWETLVLSASNADDVMRVMGCGKNSDPHLMRLMNVDFSLLDSGTEAKIRADAFKRELRVNYGVAGPEFMKYILANYDVVQKLVTQAVAKMDRKIMATAEERYWTAIMAACTVAALIARRIGLISYDVEGDIDWMAEYIKGVRGSRVMSRATPEEHISEFLETHVGNTLAVSVRSISNIDNVALHPHGELHVRHELDNERIFIARSELMRYCNDKAISLSSVETALLKSGVLIETQRKVTLGRDTKYAKGQSRCWVLNAALLGDVSPSPEQSTNIVPIRKVG